MIYETPRYVICIYSTIVIFVNIFFSPLVISYASMDKHLIILSAILFPVADVKEKTDIQSNLGSRTPRIMNNSVYEQIFRTQSVSDDYCFSSYEHASRQHRGAINCKYQLFSETEAQWV
jgi:hypothetical protein